MDLALQTLSPAVSAAVPARPPAGWLGHDGPILPAWSVFPAPAAAGLPQQGDCPAEGLRHRCGTSTSPLLLLPVFLSTGNPLQDNLWETTEAFYIYKTGVVSEASPVDREQETTKGYLVWNWECPGHPGAGWVTSHMAGDIPASVPACSQHDPLFLLLVAAGVGKGSPRCETGQGAEGTKLKWNLMKLPGGN